MNGGESGICSKKKKNIRLKLHQYEVSVQLPAFICMNHYFHRLLISSYNHIHIQRLLINWTLAIIKHLMKKI